MQRITLNIILAAVLSGLLPVLTSCRQKELVFPEAGMHVLDIDFEWPADVEAKPRGMSLWFFPLESDGRIWRFDIAGPDGGPVELPYGDYTMISCSNDVADVRISEASRPDRIKASLKATDSIAPDITPLYRVLVERVSFTPSGLRWTERGVWAECSGMFPTLFCHPSIISTDYHVELRDIHGYERIRSARMMFHGVCPDLLLYDAHSQGSILDIPAEFTPTNADGDMLASFESFGPLPDIEDATVEVTVTLTNRHVYRKTFNVSAQLANQQDSFCVKIVIEGLSIPDDGEPSDENVGMEVGVDGWTEIYIDYTTGP